MTDPFMESLATALAGSAVTALSSAGKTALEKVRELIRSRRDSDPETNATLEAAENSSGEEAKVTALAERLDQAANADPEFADRLRTEGTSVHKEINASSAATVHENSGNVRNQVQGNVHKLVQADQINGGVSL